MTFLVHNEPVAALLGPLRGPELGSEDHKVQEAVAPGAGPARSPHSADAWLSGSPGVEARGHGLLHRGPLLVRQKWPASKETAPAFPHLAPASARPRGMNGSRNPRPRLPQPGAAAGR